MQEEMGRGNGEWGIDNYSLFLWSICKYEMHHSNVTGEEEKFRGNIGQYLIFNQPSKIDRKKTN